jgi:hypothetical protein
MIYDKHDDFIAGHAKQALMAQAIFDVIGAIVAVLTTLLIGVLL